MKFLAIVALIGSQLSSLCGFVAFPCDNSAAQLGQPWVVTVSLDVSRQHVEPSWLSLWNSFHWNVWHWRPSSFFVSCDCKDNTSKDPFSQCEQLQGIHIQVKSEFVGTLTTIELVTRKQSDKHNNMFNVAANLKHVNTHGNNN